MYIGLQLLFKVDEFLVRKSFVMNADPPCLFNVSQGFQIEIK